MNRLEREALYAELFKTCGREGFTTAARRLCRTDLYFLLTVILGRKDMQRDWLHDRCIEVQDEPDGRLDLWAREHYKSTIITFGKTIQDVLANPEITVGLFSFTRPIAKAFLRQIMREFEGHETLKELFPDILWEHPRKQAPKWSEDDGIIVRRQGNPKEATIEAWGLVDGQPTSKHYGLVVYDDVVTRESVTSPDMISKVTEAWELSQSLGSDGGTVRTIGTRYHANDTYHTMIRRGSAIPRIHPATIDGTVDGEPVLMSRETLIKKRRDMGPYTFGCQMLQDPVADKAQGFKREWLQFWEPKNLGELNVYILVDPAGKKKQASDYTVMKVIGLGPDQNYYEIDCIRDRLNLTERAAALLRLHRQYRPIKVGYEQYGMQADIEHIKYLQALENYRFPIVELGGSMPKEDRIRRLVPLYEQGRFFHPTRILYVDHEKKSRDLVAEFIADEYEAFPVAAHDDMLDCQARIVDPELGARFPEQAANGHAQPSGRAIMDYNPLDGLGGATARTSYDPYGG
ncbi:MAG: hypothetical protein HY915_17970 [Desulfovibrio sp.]|nr:hypothetical protein [Desulfovibrio sp.]